METKVLDGINGAAAPGWKFSRSSMFAKWFASLARRGRKHRHLFQRTMGGREMLGSGAKGPTVIYEVSKTLYTPTRQRGSLAPRNPLFFFLLPPRYPYNTFTYIYIYYTYRPFTYIYVGKST